MGLNARHCISKFHAKDTSKVERDESVKLVALCTWKLRPGRYLSLLGVENLSRMEHGEFLSG